MKIFNSTGSIYIFFNVTDIKRMFTNQSSNEALRQTASAHKEKTEHTFHFTHQYCNHSPPTDPDSFVATGK